jgi:hypothetical protein
MVDPMMLPKMSYALVMYDNFSMMQVRCPRLVCFVVDQNKVVGMGTLKKLAQVKHNCPIRKVCGLLWALDAPRTNFISGSN